MDGGGLPGTRDRRAAPARCAEAGARRAWTLSQSRRRATRNRASAHDAFAPSRPSLSRLAPSYNRFEISYPNCASPSRHTFFASLTTALSAWASVRLLL